MSMCGLQVQLSIAQMPSVQTSSYATTSSLGSSDERRVARLAYGKKVVSSE